MFLSTYLPHYIASWPLFHNVYTATNSHRRGTATAATVLRFTHSLYTVAAHCCESLPFLPVTAAVFKQTSRARRANTLPRAAPSSLHYRRHTARLPLRVVDVYGMERGGYRETATAPPVLACCTTGYAYCNSARRPVSSSTCLPYAIADTACVAASPVTALLATPVTSSPLATSSLSRLRRHLLHLTTRRLPRLATNQRIFAHFLLFDATFSTIPVYRVVAHLFLCLAVPPAGSRSSLTTAMPCYATCSSPAAACLACKQRTLYHLPIYLFPIKTAGVALLCNYTALPPQTPPAACLRSLLKRAVAPAAFLHLRIIPLGGAALLPYTKRSTTSVYLTMPAACIFYAPCALALLTDGHFACCVLSLATT